MLSFSSFPNPTMDRCQCWPLQRTLHYSCREVTGTFYAYLSSPSRKCYGLGLYGYNALKFDRDNTTHWGIFFPGKRLKFWYQLASLHWMPCHQMNRQQLALDILYALTLMSTMFLLMYHFLVILFEYPPLLNISPRSMACHCCCQFVWIILMEYNAAQENGLDELRRLALHANPHTCQLSFLSTALTGSIQKVIILINLRRYNFTGHGLPPVSPGNCPGSPGCGSAAGLKYSWALLSYCRIDDITKLQAYFFNHFCNMILVCLKLVIIVVVTRYLYNYIYPKANSALRLQIYNGRMAGAFRLPLRTCTMQDAQTQMLIVSQL